jgi:serine/threonine protein kinase/WD40 repeat protein
VTERSVFLAALDIDDTTARSAFLDETCAASPDLRLRVEELLAAHAGPASFMARPAADCGPATATAGYEAPDPAGPVAWDGVNLLTGRYRLLAPIGEGGMGTVFMAEQIRPVHRQVALKVIKAGMDTRQVVARFEAERQALAMMDHVNIARVLDGGTTGAGRPFFVMELVRGIPITKYCDDNHLTPRERLELFVPVCLAIQHAHQKGVIHRDIKPSNVLVTLYDGNPVPKVIDFGVAKAVERKLTERTLFTQYGAVVGTLEYMSPEQAATSALGVDTRSDVYSLGVLLYELLTGSTPLGHERVKGAAYAEVLRMIQEEEPPRPSTRLTDSRETLTAVSARRHMDPAKLTKLVRGELDWIVMKTLDKDRNRRYESASALATDVRRYLADEPVQACPPSVGYRLRKLARRHKGPVLAASVVLLALVGGTVAATWGMLRATAAEAAAVGEAHQKTEALTDKEAALADAEDKLFLALLTRARAERASGRIGQRFEALKAIRAAARIRVTPELRTEAIAALVLPDVELDREWQPAPDGGTTMRFDASFPRYARLDKHGGVLVCRVTDGREEVVTRLPARGGTMVRDVQMSPDGRFVACGEGPPDAAADRVRVCKVDGPEPVAALDDLPGIGGWVVTFDPSGRQLAVVHADGSVGLYDLATRRVRRLWVGDTAAHLAFHPREDRLAVAVGRAVRLFDTQTGAEAPALPHPAPVNSLSWHPDGHRLVTGCGDRKIHVWDTRAAAEVMLPLSGHTADGVAASYNRTGELLVSLDWTGKARLWGAAGGRQLLALHGFTPHFGPDDSLLGPDYGSGKIGLWRLAGGRELLVLHHRDAGGLANLVSPVVHADGRTLAATSYRHLCFFDLTRGEELGAVRTESAERPVFFDPRGGWLTGGQSGMNLWPARPDPARPEVLQVGPPERVGPGLDGRHAAGSSASADGRVVAVPQGESTLLLDRGNPARRVELGPQYDVRFSAVSPDGRWVATCSWGADGATPTVRIWDAETGRPVRNLSVDANTSAKFSPDGRWLMTATANGTRQWEVGTWRSVRRFDRGYSAFSPDGRLMAVNDVFGAIRLVETATGREVARLTGPEPTWYAPACFTPDGTRLVASCTAETALYVWDLRLIRAGLKELGLDWDWPDFPPEKGGETKPRRVEILDADPGKPGPTLTPEQDARKVIERYRGLVAANPDDANACNGLAWVYATGPEPFRDAKAALPLAENAVRREPKNALYRNTLGVAFYRLGRFREAADVLRANLENQEDGALACDLYFLAMSQQRLGEPARARDSYELAVRWARAQTNLSVTDIEELATFRAEAEACLGVKKPK